MGAGQPVVEVEVGRRHRLAAQRLLDALEGQARHSALDEEAGEELGRGPLEPESVAEIDDPETDPKYLVFFELQRVRPLVGDAEEV